MQSTLMKSSPHAGVQLQHRVVISLPGRIVLHAPVALVPRAGAGGVGRIHGMKARPRNGQIRRHHLAWNPAHNMDAELQPLRMNPVGQRLESRPVRRRWKAVLRRNQDPVPVHTYFRSASLRPTGFCIYHPSSITAYCHPNCSTPASTGGVGLVIILVDRQPVRIPTVPPHRRRGSGFLGECQGCGQGG